MNAISTLPSGIIRTFSMARTLNRIFHLPNRPLCSCKPIELAHDVISPHPDADDRLPPIILLHALASSRATWSSMTNVIANTSKRKVYALDARNHGESGWTQEFNYDIMAKDLAYFMEKKGIPRAILIGHSLGGKTAMTLAFSQPEKVEKLILEDISPIIPPEIKYKVSRYLKAQRHVLNLIDRDMDLQTARKIIRQFFISEFQNSGNSKAIFLNSLPLRECKSEELEERICSTLPIRRLPDGSISWQANIDVLEDALVNKNCLTINHEGLYEGDVLFIYGTRSKIKVHEGKEDILKIFPKSIFFPVAGASHTIHLEYPEKYLKAVFDFI